MKRFADIILSAIALAMFAPLMVVVGLWVRVLIGSPVFFAQMRPGLRGKPFQMLKFRTMSNAVDGLGALLPDSERLSRFGRFLRSSSFDELPELWNVLKGDMSLVGPRPLLLEYMQLYTPQQARRHEAKPGITGWAQINGRNAISWEQKFVLDVWYVDNQSFWLDCKILWKTVLKVLRRDGISAAGEVTMPRFTGTSSK